jgi:hypothetical protein
MDLNFQVGNNASNGLYVLSIDIVSITSSEQVPSSTSKLASEDLGCQITTSEVQVEHI